MRLSEPMAAAANPAVQASPTSSVPRVASTRRQLPSPAISTTETATSAIVPAIPAPRVALSSSSCSRAGPPVTRTRTPLPAVSPSSRASARTRSTIRPAGSSSR